MTSPICNAKAIVDNTARVTLHLQREQSSTLNILVKESFFSYALCVNSCVSKCVGKEYKAKLFKRPQNSIN